MKVLYVKNMVCKKCVSFVEQALIRIGVEIQSIKKGKVSYSEKEVPLLLIRNTLDRNGFELLLESEFSLLEQIKNYIIDIINHQDIEKINHSNISNLLEEKFESEYQYLNSLFASIENVSIEYFIIYKKIEKAKELLKYEQLTLRETSVRLGFRSMRQLSDQIKTITGLPANQFRNIVAL